MSASEWRSTSQPPLEYGTGAEQISRAALLQIQGNITAQCALIDNLWLSRDQDFAAARGYPFQPTKTIVPAKTSLYLGAQPSLVSGDNANFDRWPAITVRCGSKDPTNDQPDQYDEYRVELVVEVLAKAGPFQQNPLEDRATSDAADRQYQRLSDAVVGCINADRSLGGNVHSIQNAPQMTPSIPWVRTANRDATSSGGWLVFQAQELVWTVTRLSRVPGL